MSLQRNAFAVAMYQRLMRVGVWWQGLASRGVPAPFRLLQIGSAYWQSRALHAAVVLELADILGEETLTVQELATRAAAAPEPVLRMMRMLAALGVFEETGEAAYRNNAASHCLRRDVSGSVREMILLHNSDEMSMPWYTSLIAGLRDDAVPFELVHGRELFDYLDHHPAFEKQFSSAMNQVEALIGDSFATDFRWDRFQRVIDIGGSHGAKSIAILKQWPQLTALVFDRPQVIETAEESVRRTTPPEVAARLSWQAGNLFDGVPPARDSGDVMLLCAVLHGLDDDTAVRALLRVAEGLGNSGAKAMIMEMVLPDRHVDYARSTFDMQMFVGSRGKERTLEQWLQLFEPAGLVLEEVVNLRSMGSMLVLRKA